MITYVGNEHLGQVVNMVAPNLNLVGSQEDCVCNNIHTSTVIFTYLLANTTEHRNANNTVNLRLKSKFGFSLIFLCTKWQTTIKYVRFEVFTAVTMKNGVFKGCQFLQEPHGVPTQKTPFFNNTIM
jgi:hypothetical protein